MAISDKINSLSPKMPVSCKEANEFIVDYLEGSVDERTRLQFEAHLRNCPNCERFFDQYRETINLVQNNAQVEMPEEIVANTLAFLRAQYERDRPS